MLSEGNQSLNAKQYDPAVQKLQAAVNLQPSNVDGQTALVKAKQGKDDQAAQAHKQQTAAAKPPTSGNPQFAQAIERARTAIAASQFDAARTALGEAMRIEASNPENHKVQQELADAQKAARRGNAKPPGGDTQKEKFQALLVSAHKAVAAKQIDDAEKSLAQARAINASDPQVAQVQKEIDAAKVVHVNGTQEKEAAYDAAMKAGNQSLSVGKFDDAIHSAQEALRQKPNDTPASQLLSQAEKAKATVAAQPKTEPNLAEYEKYRMSGSANFLCPEELRSGDSLRQRSDEDHKPADAEGDQDRQRFPRRPIAGQEG